MTEKHTFKKILLDDSYINWLNTFMQDKEEINDNEFIIKNNSYIKIGDILMLKYLKYLYKEIELYFYQKTIYEEFIYYFFEYKNTYYKITNDGIGITLKKYTKKQMLETAKLVTTFNMGKYFPIIEYKKLKSMYSTESQALANNINITSFEQILYELYDGDDDIFYQTIHDFLKDDEINFIIKNLNNKSCSTCILNNNVCKLTEDNKKVLGIFDPNFDNDCLSWYNNTLIGKSKVLKINDINKLK